VENLVVFCCAAWSAAAAGVTRVGDVGPCVYVYGMVTSRANGLSLAHGEEWCHQGVCYLSSSG